jgi:uncharacterized membrane protein
MEKTSQATITAQVHQLRRLEMLIDVVYALVILRIFTLIPRPEKGDFAWGTIVEFLLSDKGDLIMALVGMVIVIIYWTQNNTIFGNLVRTDNRHATLTIIQLFSLLLFLYALRMGTFFEGTTGARVFESSAAALLGISSAAGWYYAMHNQRLVRPDMTGVEAHDLLVKVLAEPFAALLTIPCAFIGPVVWEIAWLSFIPFAQVLKRLRPKW